MPICACMSCIPLEMTDEQAWRMNDHNIFLYKNIPLPLYFSKGVIAGV